MPLPKPHRDPMARAKLVMDMLTGDAPNDKERVLAALREQEPEPTGSRQGRESAGRQPDGRAA